MVSPDPSSPPPPRTTEEAVQVAARIGGALPAECIPGVTQNLALLDEHWTMLTGFAPFRA